MHLDRSAPRRHRPGVAARPAPAALDELDGRGRHAVHRRLGRSARARSAPVRRCTSGRTTVDDETLRALGPARAVRRDPRPDRMSFPTRRVQSVYLDWFHAAGRRRPPAPPSSVGPGTRPRPSTSSTTATGRQTSARRRRASWSSTSSCSPSATSTPSPTTAAPALAAFAASTASRTCPPGTPPSRTCRSSRRAPT